MRSTPDLPRFEDPSEVIGLETAFDCERKGWLNSAVAGYSNMVAAYAELASVEPSAKIDGLACLFGLLRCARRIPSGAEHIPGYENVANELLSQILADEDLTLELKNCAEKLASPLAQDAFGEKGRYELRDLSFEAVVNTSNRFSITQ